MEYFYQNGRIALIFNSDLDDVLNESSSLLQDQVNQKTNFKTETLKTLEQINRNCNYYYKKVIEICNYAKLKHQVPDLSGLPNFKYFKLNKSNMYDEPIKFAKNYCNIARSLLDLYLEERDTFLEIDNMKFGQIKSFNYQDENRVIDYFKDLIRNNEYDLDRINRYALEEIKKICLDAKSRCHNNFLIIPEYGDLVKMDNNDIIKKSSLSINSNKERILYKKPIEDIETCAKNIDLIDDVIVNADVFSTPSREKIDYSKIYTREHTINSALNLCNNIMNSGMVDIFIVLTHHNGDRECECKREYVKDILPYAKFEGMRFHDFEHNAGRRPRSNKIGNNSKMNGYHPHQQELMDDSCPNCIDCKNLGAKEILYKPYTDAEIIKGRLENLDLYRITEFDSSLVLPVVYEKRLELDNYVKVKSRRWF